MKTMRTAETDTEREKVWIMLHIFFFFISVCTDNIVEYSFIHSFDGIINSVWENSERKEDSDREHDYIEYNKRIRDKVNEAISLFANEMFVMN